jgi:transcriptional regulator of acetoin/glycerol metabolism
MIAEGTFREDLYYRINGLVVTLPALRERTDLAALVERMLELQPEADGLPRRVSAAVLERFMQCRWPGNLRQLANVLRTASIMAEGMDQIELDDLPEDFLHDCDDAAADDNAPSTVEAVDDGTGDAGSAHTPQPSRMDDWQAALIAQTLARLDGNVSAAARELGLARNTVYRYLRRGGAAH